MNTFQAGVQYDDFKGTVAADISDNVAFIDYLKKAGLAQDGDLLAAIRIASSENQGKSVNDISVVSYLYRAQGYQAAPAEVRAVEAWMSPTEFLAFFKRFDLVMTRKGMDLSATEVDGPHYD